MKKVLGILAVLILLPCVSAAAVNFGGDAGGSFMNANALVIGEDNGLWDLKKDPPEKILDNVKSFCEEDKNFVITYDGSLWNVENEPEKIMENVKTLYENYYNHYVICDDNSLWAWGENKFGDLGIGNDEAQDSPVKVMDDVKDLFVKSSSVFAIKTDKTLWSWGVDHKTLGFHALKDQYTPVKIHDNVKKVYGERTVMYALCEDDTLWSWGIDTDTLEGWHIYSSVLGRSDGTKDEIQYRPIKIIDDVKSFYTVGVRTMVIKNDGSLWAWGAGPMPNYKNSDHVPVKLLDSAKEVHLKHDDIYDYSYILDGNDELWIYGKQLEDRKSYIFIYSEKVERKLADSPVSVVNLPSSYDHAYTLHLTLTENGELWETKLAYGERKVTDHVTALYNASTGSDIYFLKEDGSLWRIISEYVKDQFTTQYVYSEPEKILDDAVDVKAYSDHSGAAVTKDGALYLWGDWQGVFGEDSETVYTPKKVFDGVRIDDTVRVFVNGAEVTAEAYVKDGRTLVPMRAIFEALGASVTWDNEAKCAIAVKNDTEVKIAIGEAALYKNGEKIELDVAAELEAGRTMVPVRAVSEAFGAKVDWRNATKSVMIKGE